MRMGYLMPTTSVQDTMIHSTKMAMEFLTIVIRHRCLKMTKPMLPIQLK